MGQAEGTRKVEVRYAVVYINEGGGDVRTYDNLRDVVRDCCTDDEDIVALARAELGDWVSIGDGMDSCDVFVIKAKERG